MTDEYVEVTSESWARRLGDSIKGILVGVLLLGLGIVLLFWNEGRAVKRSKTLQEGTSAVVSVASGMIEPAHEGALVHFTGEAVTAETLFDPDFGQQVKALRLRREVEMFQWHEQVSTEEKKKLGGGSDKVKVYTYRTEWAGDAINSGDFKVAEWHYNPPFELTDREWQAQRVDVGGFRLGPELRDQLTWSEKIELGNEQRAAVPEPLRQRLLVRSGSFYLGIDPAEPQVGDLRIHFKVVRPAMVSVVAKQQGNEAVAYRTRGGGTIALLEPGNQSATAMFEAATQANVLTTWLLRLSGFVLSFLGFGLILRPLSVLADVIPVLGGLVAGGSGLIALLAAGLVSLVTVALGWIFFRPLLGSFLLLLAGGLVVAIVMLAHKRRAERPAVV